MFDNFEDYISARSGKKIKGTIVVPNAKLVGNITIVESLLAHYDVSFVVFSC